MFQSPDPNPPVTRNIPIEKVYIPEGRKLRFDPKDERNQHLIDSMHRAGLIHPIEVRPAGDKFELVCGRRRLAAAKKLEWETIPAKITEYEDDEIGYVSIVENAHRKQLKPAQAFEAEVHLMKEYERLYGTNPGRRIGGMRRAQMAQRSEGGKFLSGSSPTANEEGIEPEFLVEAPATGATPTAGSGVAVEGDTARNVKSVTQYVSEQMGADYSETAKDLKAAKAFTEDQLRALQNCEGFTKKDLRRVAKIKNPNQRNDAINLIMNSTPVDEAIAMATGVSAETPAAVKEPELSDHDWLQTYCYRILGDDAEVKLAPGEQRHVAKLEDDRDYRRAALLYRNIRTELAMLKAKTKKPVEKSHFGGPTHFTWILVQTLGATHPNDWLICPSCLGLNKEKPDCAECKGTGFRVKVEWPKKPR